MGSKEKIPFVKMFINFEDPQNEVKDFCPKSLLQESI
jgi:hypothetical protein